jgi:divalent metal cation (Fe/Co/Zn/Cd) transporter
MAIGVLLIVVAAMVGYEVKALLVGQGVEPHVRKDMLDFLCQQPKVKEVLSLLTLHMGSDVMVAIKAHMADCGSSDGLAEEINRIEVAFRARFPQVHWTFFEPDVR